MHFKEEEQFFFQDLGVFRGLAYANPKLLDFIIETEIGPILKYDEREKGRMELITTLRAFIDLGRNVFGTAQKLFLHRNTLNYRLNRISAIVNNSDMSSQALNNTWGMISDNIPVLEGIQLGVQAHRARDYLENARRLCGIENPEDLL